MQTITHLKRTWAHLKHWASIELSKGPNDPQTLHQQLALYNPDNLKELDLHTDTESTIESLAGNASTDAAILSSIHLDLQKNHSIVMSNRELDPKQLTRFNYFLDSQGNYVDAVYMMKVIKSQLLEIARYMTQPDKTLSDNNRVILSNNLPAFHRYMESHLRLTYTGTLRTTNHGTKSSR